MAEGVWFGNFDWVGGADKEIEREFYRQVGGDVPDCAGWWEGFVPMASFYVVALLGARRRADAAALLRATRAARALYAAGDAGRANLGAVEALDRAADARGDSPNWELERDRAFCLADPAGYAARIRAAAIRAGGGFPGPLDRVGALRRCVDAIEEAAATGAAAGSASVQDACRLRLAAAFFEEERTGSQNNPAANACTVGAHAGSTATPR